MICKRYWVPLLLLVMAVCSADQTQAQEQAEQKTLLVHYMPWFSTKQVSGSWGWHWKMKNCNPDKIANGKREIASHYYPMIGPYDSTDRHVLECQVALMKIAGIDGIVLDWYGIVDHWDYASLHRNSLAMIEVAKKAGLKFAVCFEDKTAKHLSDAKKIESDKAYGVATMRWLASNWFSDESYVTLGGRPVLMVFGPQHYEDDQLKKICQAIENPPLLFTLPHLATAAKSDGVMGWLPVDGGKETTLSQLENYLGGVEKLESDGNQVVASAFPQFHDFYQQGNNQPSFGSLKQANGNILKSTLDRALDGKSKLVQIATWNDYGEGTMIEPTEEFGFQFLEVIQKLRLPEDTDWNKAKKRLRLPIQIYKGRSGKGQSMERLKQLDQASRYLLEGKYEIARKLMESEADSKATHE